MSKRHKRINKKQQNTKNNKIIIIPNYPLEIYDSNGVLRVKIGAL